MNQIVLERRSRPAEFFGLAMMCLTLLPALSLTGASRSFPFVTFSPPDTAPGGGEFGWAVTAVGTDKVLVGAPSDQTGAPYAGAAYLFKTDGRWLMTFTNPAPAEGDHFGSKVAALGTDRVLISAYLDDVGGRDFGAVYLFNIKGHLLTTFTNPNPAAHSPFGRAVAAVGTNRVLIGTSLKNTGPINAGVAYLFTADGSLLATFTNPTPGALDEFGSSVAAVGDDQVLIGARGDNTGAIESGAAHLFNTNGKLVTTFINPEPGVGDHFGNSVAAVGTDRVLIAAFRDRSLVGSAYLFNTKGVLLTTFTNPVPGSFRFGESVAAMGTSRVLIGTPFDNTGEEGAGAVHLFSASGRLLASFNNPNPTNSGNFGNAVALVGTNEMLIGAWRNKPPSAFLFKLD